MGGLLRIWLALAFLLVMVSAQTITPVNITSPENEAVNMSITMGDNMALQVPVLPLTQKAGQDIPSASLNGICLLANASSQLSLESTNIAFISCEPPVGDLGPVSILNTATQQNVTGVVFYSQTSEWCQLTDYQGTYPWIYSMKGTNDTTLLLRDIFGPDVGHDGQWRAAIQTKHVVNASNNNSSDSGSTQGQTQNPLGPSPSTAVAMIILYSITGIITALFLIIIITGALRAHRHPERYGPRNIMGRPRQSRARGLARAMVDTLPIVKFGERNEAKPVEVELGDATNATTATTEGQERSERQDATTEAEAGDHTQPAHEDGNAPGRPSTNEGGISAAIDGGRPSSRQGNPEHQGCSICTEDFEAGQDQRVLPCDHRFHPACVDPWLLNVSGTCPLCRIDLRPRTSSTSETGELDENGNPVVREGEMAPPLGLDETAGDRQRMSIRRSIMLGLMGIGRPDHMTREERVLALRALRGQQLARARREAQAAVTQTPEEETSTRTRLRHALGIRTRRTDSQAQAQAQGPEAREEPRSS